MQPLLKLRERILVKYTSRMNRESAGKIVKKVEEVFPAGFNGWG